MDILLALRRYIHRENLTTPFILEEMEEVSKKVITILEKLDIRELMFGQIFPQDADFNSMLIYFHNILSDALSKVEIPPKLQNYILHRTKLGGKNIEDNQTAWESLFTIAFLDIYSLVLIAKYLHINKRILIGVLLLSMKRGSAKNENLISYIVYDELIMKDGNLEKTSLIGRLKSEAPGNSHVQKLGESSCPFDASSEKQEWIERVWKLCEDKIIPFMQEQGKNKNLYWEKFYSGTLETKKSL